MQLLPGLYANVAQESARHLAEERLDEIQPGSVFGRQNIMEPIGTGRQVGLGLLGEVRRMVIQDQTQDPIRRVESIQVLEQSDEFAAAMPPLDPGGYVTGVQIQGRQDEQVPRRFYSWSRPQRACRPGTGFRSGAVLAMAWTPGFSSTETVTTGTIPPC